MKIIKLNLSLFILLVIISTNSIIKVLNITEFNLDSNDNLIPKLSFDLINAKECMNVVRRYYFFASIFYEMISISNCMSKSSDIDIRLQISKKIIEINYYRNLFAKYIVDSGYYATFYEIDREFPRKETNSFNICFLLKFINLKELYYIEKNVLIKYSLALSEFKKYILSDIQIGICSTLLKNIKKDLIDIASSLDNIISYSIQNINLRSTDKIYSILYIHKFTNKYQIIRIFREILKKQILQIVTLKSFIKKNNQEFSKKLDDLENKNKMPPKSFIL